jgi:hypothetical protein
MDENQHRRLSIARELMTWANALPRLIQQIDEVASLPRLTEMQTSYVESIAERLGVLLRAIQAAVASDESYEHLTASVDQLREEIITATDTLDRMLQPLS